jgi:hypothetical protein
VGEREKKEKKDALFVSFFAFGAAFFFGDAAFFFLGDSITTSSSDSSWSLESERTISSFFALLFPFPLVAVLVALALGAAFFLALGAAAGVSSAVEALEARVERFFGAGSSAATEAATDLRLGACQQHGRGQLAV